MKHFTLHCTEHLDSSSCKNFNWKLSQYRDLSWADAARWDNISNVVWYAEENWAGACFDRFDKTEIICRVGIASGIYIFKQPLKQYAHEQEQQAALQGTHSPVGRTQPAEQAEPKWSSGDEGSEIEFKESACENESGTSRLISTSPQAT